MIFKGMAGVNKSSCRLSSWPIVKYDCVAHGIDMKSL